MDLQSEGPERKQIDLRLRVDMRGHVLSCAGKSIRLVSNAVLTSSVTMSASSDSGRTRTLRAWSYCRGEFWLLHCLSRAHWGRSLRWHRCAWRPQVNARTRAAL